MASIKNYGLNSTAVEEWIPWGGIVKPSVMREKDSSLFSVIRYEPYTIPEENAVTPWPFRRGWVLWNECQHTAGGERKNYLVICWNPFLSDAKNYAQNALHEKIPKDKLVDGFDKEVHRFLDFLREVTDAELLEYQELMDFLSFTVSFGEDHPKMPDVPLYMDALLTQDIDFRFTANDIFINDKRLLMLSLPSSPNPEPFYAEFAPFPYRHVRRLELFSQKEAKRDFIRYTKKWFPSRSIVRKLGTQNLHGAYNGYFMECFCFLLERDNYAELRKKLSAFLYQRECPYLIESFNLKEAFWGSIPGLYLANNRPPIVGFQHLADFLFATVKKKPKPKIVLEKKTLTKTEQDLKETLIGEEEPDVSTGSLQPAS